MISLKELAEKAGVSIATISNILNGKANVSEATRQRVLKLIEETGYKTNPMASRLRLTKTKTVGLIIDDLGAFSTPGVIEGIISVLEAQGYKAIIETVRLYAKYQNNPENIDYINAVNDCIEQMKSIRVDGIIMVAAHSHNIEFLPDELELPFIIAYAYSKNKKLIHINVDDFNSAFEITEYLIKKGFKKIGVIGGIGDVKEQVRFSGYKAAMEKYNISVDYSLYHEGAWNRESGYTAAQALVPLKPEAIFCFNDLMAAGLYDYLYENNIQPGKDIAVAGFDNRDISEFLNPPLTTMELPLFDIGKVSAQKLLKIINGTETQIKSEEIPCRLIERKSSLTIN